jgi:transposase
VVVGGVNARLEVILPPRRIELGTWPRWARANLCSTDALVVESTSNAWDFYDQVAPLVGQALVANPRLVKLIASGRVKTDKVDTLALAKLLATGFLPTVWVPPQEVREARGLLAHRRRLVRNRTMVTNRLQSVLLRHNLASPDGEPFSAANRPWWDTLMVSPTEKLRVRQDLATLKHLAEQIAELDVEVVRLSTMAPWAEQVTYVMQLPGFSVLLTMTVLAAIGDITRFQHAKQLVGYAGLGASVHDSGQTHHTGHITKTGRRELRWALVEAAWSAVRYHPYWKTEFERLARRMPNNKAIVAIARKLLVALWHVLTERVADQHADPKMVATKLMRWSWELTDEQRDGLTTRQFIRCQLMRLQLGQQVAAEGRGSARIFGLRATYQQQSVTGAGIAGAGIRSWQQSRDRFPDGRFIDPRQDGQKLAAQRVIIVAARHDLGGITRRMEVNGAPADQHFEDRGLRFIRTILHANADPSRIARVTRSVVRLAIVEAEEGQDQG